MAFNSLSYLLFLPAVYLVFYLSSSRWRWLVLLLGSYVFYATLGAPYLLAVLLASTGISYACARKMAVHHEDAVRKRWLWTGSLACVAMLALFKYLPFAECAVKGILGDGSTVSTTILNIGVSYFTFQAISYLADVYLEVEEPEQHLGHYALYLAFFPKLLQGPIERGGDLLPQFKKPYRFDYDAMRSGLLLFACGLFKKVVLADRLALYADQIYNNVHNYTGPALIVGTYAYALQLYFDFSAYTDMARGTAQLFGLNLTENFNRPYLATTIADFWRRWHISFSRWILDYIFKPLQMTWRNWGQAGTACALMVTFLVSGIWHGASWGFLIWGGIHGAYLASSTYYRPYQKKLYKWLGVEKSTWLKGWQILVTFNLVAFGWIFFRASSLENALYIVNSIVRDTARDIFSMNSFAAFRASQFKDLARLQSKEQLIGTAVALLAFFALVKYRGRLPQAPGPLRWFCYYALVAALFFLGTFNSGSHFIYVQF